MAEQQAMVSTAEIAANPAITAMFARSLFWLFIFVVRFGGLVVELVKCASVSARPQLIYEFLF